MANPSIQLNRTKWMLSASTRSALTEPGAADANDVVCPLRIERERPTFASLAFQLNPGPNGAKLSTPYFQGVAPWRTPTQAGSLCYTTPSRGGCGCAVLASESISTDRSTLRRAL